MLNIMLINLKNMPLLTGIKNNLTVLLEYISYSWIKLTSSDCALLGIMTVLLEYIDRLMPIMPALCSMLLATYYAFNYAGIIGRGLPTSDLCLLLLQPRLLCPIILAQSPLPT